MNNIILLNSQEFVPIVKAYIDPGTGSMLFTIMIGLVSVIVYGFKGVWIKLKSLGKNTKDKDERILPIVIYTDSKRYWNVFKPICDEFENLGSTVYYFTQSKDDPAFKEKYNYVIREFIGEGNKGFARMNFLKANVVISSTPALDVYQWKRSKSVKHYVHIFHVVRDVTTYRMFGIDYFDSLLLSGSYQIEQVRKLERLRKLPSKECKVVGCAYMDEMKNRFLKTENKQNSIVNILLAPSWGPSSIFVKYGTRILDELVKTGYHIIVRPHPQSFDSDKKVIEEIIKKYPETSQIEWNRDNDNFDVLCKSDILISDFSGVIYDFALVFDKPIIYTDTLFDKSIYDACWLDEEMWTFTTLTNIGEKLDNSNISNIKNMIDNCINNPAYREGREKARQEAWQNQGKAAKDVVNYLINKNHAIEENR